MKVWIFYASGWKMPIHAHQITPFGGFDLLNEELYQQKPQNTSSRGRTSYEMQIVTRSPAVARNVRPYWPSRKTVIVVYKLPVLLHRRTGSRFSCAGELAAVSPEWGWASRSSLCWFLTCTGEPAAVLPAFTSIDYYRKLFICMHQGNVFELMNEPTTKGSVRRAISRWTACGCVSAQMNRHPFYRRKQPICMYQLDNW